MMFSDAKRFHKNIQIRDGVEIHHKEFTADHVGPGVYFHPENEDTRGWAHAKKSFSKREPFAPGAKRHGQDRTHHYVAGILLDSGIIVAGHTSDKNTPGPGHYGSSIIESPDKSKNARMSRSKSVGRSSRNNISVSLEMGNSRRLAHNDTIIRDGIVFHAHSVNESSVGPGHYSIPNDPFYKKSFNVRASPSGRPRTPGRLGPRSPNANNLNNVTGSGYGLSPRAGGSSSNNNNNNTGRPTSYDALYSTSQGKNSSRSPNGKGSGQRPVSRSSNAWSDVSLHSLDSGRGTPSGGSRNSGSNLNLSLTPGTPSPAMKQSLQQLQEQQQAQIQMLMANQISSPIGVESVYQGQHRSVVQNAAAANGAEESY